MKPDTFSTNNSESNMDTTENSEKVIPVSEVSDIISLNNTIYLQTGFSQIHFHTFIEETIIKDILSNHHDKIKNIKSELIYDFKWLVECAVNIDVLSTDTQNKLKDFINNLDTAIVIDEYMLKDLSIHGSCTNNQLLYIFQKFYNCYSKYIRYICKITVLNEEFSLSNQASKVSDKTHNQMTKDDIMSIHSYINIHIYKHDLTSRSLRTNTFVYIHIGYRNSLRELNLFLREYASVVDTELKLVNNFFTSEYMTESDLKELNLIIEILNSKDETLDYSNALEHINSEYVLSIIRDKYVKNVLSKAYNMHPTIYQMIKRMKFECAITSGPSMYSDLDSDILNNYIDMRLKK